MYSVGPNNMKESKMFSVGPNRLGKFGSFYRFIIKLCVY